MRKSALYLRMLSMTVFASVCHADVTLVRNGRAAAVVVTADDATGTARYAADELVEHLEKATGVRLPVATESDIPEGYQSRLFVGMTQAAENMGIDAHSLSPDAYILRTEGGDLYVLGQEDPERDLRLEEPLRSERHILDTGDRGMWPISQNGTLFGVYEILQRYAGVRWLWPGELGTYTPRSDSIRIEDTLDEHHEPALKFRRYRWWSVYRGASRGITDEHGLSFSERGLVSYWRDLGIYLGRHRLGQSEEKPPVGHFFSGWWQRYGREHPEWFMMDADGNRGHANPNALHVSMCVSNPDLHRYLVEEAWDGGDFLRLGSVDSRGECQCEACLAWDGPQPDDYPEGVRRDYEPQVVSDRYARFWKTIQAMAAERNPDVTVTSFLYWNYFPAPLGGIELNENIYGEFCPWTGDGAYYPMPEDVDKWLRDQWKGWHATGIRMGYRPNLMHGAYVMPDLNTWQAGEFFRFAYEHGMEGIDFDSLYGQWATQGPMLYMYMRLSWDPELEIEAIRREYFSAFGPAEEQVEAYFDYWEHYSAVREGGSLYHHAWRAHGIYTDDVFQEAGELLDRALETAREHPRSEYKERVMFLMAGLKHARLTARAMSFFDRSGNPPVFPEPFREGRKALRELIAFRREHEDRYIADLSYAYRKERSVKAGALLGEYLGGYTTDLRLRPLVPGVVLDALPATVAIRNEATYLLDATADEAVEIRIRHRQAGSQPGDVAYVMLSPSGEVVREGTVPIRETATFVFEPRETGVHTLVCIANLNGMWVSSTGRLSILHPKNKPLRLFGTQESLYFYVPEGTKDFSVMLAGRGEWSLASAAIIDAHGAVVEEKDNITGIDPHAFDISREDAEKGEIWEIQFRHPSERGVQDFFMTLSDSLPPLLSSHRDTLLVPTE